MALNLIKKIALLGNMNNNFFAFQRHLKDYGLDADLLLYNNENEHFHPICDSFSTQQAYTIKRLDWGSIRSFFLTSKRKIKKDLAAYDFIIGCGTAPAFLEKIGRKLDIFIPYGGDICEYTFYKKPTGVYNILFNRLVFFQRKGIIQAKLAFDFSMGTDIFNDSFLKLGKKCLSGYFPFIYYNKYQTIESKSVPEELYEQIECLKQQYSKIILSHSRHIWTTYVSKYSFKGNDILIEGFANYLKNTHENPLLIFTKYGVDVKHSIELIKKLGIEKNVLWLEIMPRKHIMYIIQHCDVVADQFAVGWLGGTSCEALTMYKPLLCFLKKKDEQVYPPILNAKTAADITKQLLHIEDPQVYQQMTSKIKDWFEKNMGDVLVKKWIKLIEKVKSDSIAST